jgi:two-component system sensor histidine kinase/response regulator
MLAAERPRLLVVDDEAALLRALCETLQLEGYVTRGFASATQALAALQPGEHDLLLTDLTMPEMNGIELTSAARLIDPDLAVIVMTGYGTIDTAVKAMQGGALDYILKPFKLNVVLQVIARALAIQRLQRDNNLLQQRERQQADELAAANKALEAFSYSVSHDLRAPLRSVDSLVQILQEDHGEHLNEDARGILSVIHDGCRRMDHLITGLLAFSQSARQALDAMPIDMASLARAALSEVKTAHTGPEAAVEIAPLPPATGDATLLRQVWCNLIGNALKYSSKLDLPKIRISGRTEGRESIYRVEDNGAGFDMKYAHKLFGVFQRLHKEEDFTGNGVGLAIVRRIVVRHGGRIRAEATPNVGAAFEFSLPIIEITD